MPKITVVFGSVLAADKPAYLRQRIAMLHAAGAYQFNGDRSLIASNELSDYVSIIDQAIKEDITPPLADEIDLAAIGGEAGNELRRRKVCMLDEVKRFFPLVDGELVEKNSVSYLTDEWEDFPAHAIALKQVTNLSVCYYIYPDTTADLVNNQLVEAGLVSSGQPVRHRLMGSDSPNFGEAAKTLAESMAGLMPPPMDTYGSALISLLWPSGDDAAAQWLEMYKTLQKIIKNGLAEAEISRASTKVKGFVMFLDNEYSALKKSPVSTKQNLLDALAPYDVIFFQDIVNVFMYTKTDEQQLAAAALANFMTGACLHINLNQERALVDPRVTNPADSPYAHTLSNLAKTYADYAEKAAPVVKQLRMDQIGTVQSSSNTYCRGGRAPSCTTMYSYWFTDSNNDYKSEEYNHNSSMKNPPDSQGDAQRALEAYKQKISQEMDDLLKSQVYDVVASLRLLAKNAFPGKK